MPLMERQASKLQKSHFAQQNFNGLHVCDKRRSPSAGCSKSMSSKAAAREEAMRTLSVRGAS